jgi:hypothetical protein
LGGCVQGEHGVIQPAQGCQRFHVARLAEQVDRQNRGRAGSDAGRDSL